MMINLKVNHKGEETEWLNFQFSDPLDLTPCLRRCIKMENSKFARKCKKAKGYFKCCLTYWRIDPFENTRNNLIDAGLIKGKKTKFCRVTKSGKSTCIFCSISGFCSEKDPFTGTVVNTFYPGNNTYKKGKGCLKKNQ